MSDLANLLEKKSLQYNSPNFIPADPISIPHRFTKKEDIEISGFLTALISWGRRDLIIRNASNLMQLMGNQPYEFITNCGQSELKKVTGYYYRTFNSDDLLFLVNALKNVYLHEGGLERLATDGFNIQGKVIGGIMGIRHGLLKYDHLKRSEKHLANPETGSAAKRINMFFRWMVRNDNRGVDFGLWKGIPPVALMCPLDLHSGRVARMLGLLRRKQNDWKAVEELTANLRKLDPQDPVKYDFALFGLGVNEGTLHADGSE